MIVCAVLAAGGSSRLGEPKQLLEWNGKPLVVHAVEAARQVGPVAVVVGASAVAVKDVLGVVSAEPNAATMRRVPPLTFLTNEEWASGMASSVRVATRWARSIGADALLLHLVDQPLIDGTHLSRLVADHLAGAPLVGTLYAGVVGAPALFSSAFYDALEELDGDRGAAPILRAHAGTRSVPAPDGALDIDTPSDVARLRAKAR